LLRKIVALSRERHLPVAYHLAESTEEKQLLECGKGPLRELLEARRAWSPGEVKGRNFLGELKLLAEAQRVLVIHGNYLDDGALTFLAKHRHMFLVFCPRTYCWFSHETSIAEKAIRLGVQLVVGTDSRASSPSLSMLEELRVAARIMPRISPQKILRMGTIEAARALGCQRRLGSLQSGKVAHLVAVRMPAADRGDLLERILLEDLVVHEVVLHGVVAGRAVIHGEPPDVSLPGH